MLKPSGRWADLINDLIPDVANDGCEHCGKDFTKTRPNNRFCSRSCKQMAWLARTKPPLDPLQCAGCGITIPHNGIGPRRKTCSEPCRLIHQQNRRKDTP